LVCIGLLLNLVNPSKLRNWQKVLLPLLEIAVTGNLLTFCGIRYVSVLYPTIVGKASTYLDIKGTFSIIGAAVAALLFSMWARVHGQDSLTVHWDLTGVNLALFIILRSAAIIVVTICAAWLTLTLISERQTRIRAEQLAQQVDVLARKIERARIARDIHDTLGHTLTSLNIQLDLARMPGRNVPDDVLKMIDVAKQLAEQSFDDLKGAIHMLRESDFNLKNSLETLAARFARESNMAITLDINLPSIEQETSNHLYLLVLEIITNARKHAQASHLSISLFADDGNIMLVGEDNGKGFDTTSDSSGFGLKGMRERIASIGGALEIASAPTQHTKIKITIPKAHVLATADAPARA
jgi:signal transduction histidine kinase